ncbi:DUF6940 family protein [Nannocystis radixulma]|uniref:Uncharacterized protein n=1 Tax=Nannocystis radixulma TaxID=2995305 RepID=A0ABT5BFR0_9BACT|nr:hypothetical protein [Nannocystis radixulma]MDC0672991.1 hypothetical protein [Nannocystis radixulma]
MSDEVVFTCEALAADTRRHRLLSGGSAVSWAAFAAGLRGDPRLRSLLTATLAACPFAGFFWETPAVAAATTGSPFEMVVVAAPHLTRTLASPEAFAEHLEPGPSDVRTFANLGGDAVLVVPRGLVDAAAYGHLAAFVRAAPVAQIDALWQAVGAALAAAWARSPAPVWLSTSGSAVPWLHVRLDARPKYYAHAPYRTRPATAE